MSILRIMEPQRAVELRALAARVRLGEGKARQLRQLLVGQCEWLALCWRDRRAGVYVPPPLGPGAVAPVPDRETAPRLVAVHNEIRPVDLDTKHTTVSLIAHMGMGIKS